MKTIFLSLTLLGTCTVNAQSLKINKVDPYTKQNIKETSNFHLYNGLSRAVIAKIRNTDNSIYLCLDLKLQRAFEMAKGDLLYLLLDDGTTITLSSLDGGVGTYTTHGRHFQGNVAYRIPSEYQDILIRKRIKGIRLDMVHSDYLEFNDISEENADDFIEALGNILH